SRQGHLRCVIVLDQAAGFDGALRWGLGPGPAVRHAAPERDGRNLPVAPVAGVVRPLVGRVGEAFGDALQRHRTRLAQLPRRGDVRVGRCRGCASGTGGAEDDRQGCADCLTGALSQLKSASTRLERTNSPIAPASPFKLEGCPCTRVETSVRTLKRVLRRDGTDLFETRRYTVSIPCTWMSISSTHP